MPDGATVSFSPQQVEAIERVGAWLKNPADKPIFRLFGYAGTGKTTIARHLAADIKNVQYCAFTGKAALMMRRAGCVNAKTIHSLIYRVIDEGDGSVRFLLDPEGACKTADLIVVDECSMVDEELGRDLLSYGKPILVLGDPAQLPPVKGGGFFTEATPDVMLTEIHRQAEGNPIVMLATTVRQGGVLEHGSFGASRVVPRGLLSAQDIVDADQVLVGRNVTRHAYNARIRKFYGRASQMPEPGDKLVCLKNDRQMGLFNGGIHTVIQVPKRRAKGKIRLKIGSEDFPERGAQMVQVRREFFFGGVEQLDWRELRQTQQFDYGYALTCHKSQGSQWSHVIVYNESEVFGEDARRWLYTAITRASDRITLVL